MRAPLQTCSTAGVGATLSHVKDVAAQPVPAPEKPLLSDDERAARLAMLAKRLRDPDGLDREDALAD